MKLNVKGGEMDFNISRDLISQKRGVSGVVTAVLLILLVIAAIWILWVVVQNFVQERASGVSGQADCLQTSFEPVSATATSTETTITIRRNNGNSELSAIRISDGTTTRVANPVNPAVGESATASGFPVLTGSIDVSVAFDLADGTSCALQSIGSITVT